MKSGTGIVDLILPGESPGGPDYRRRVEWLMLLRLVVTTLLLGATIFFQLSQSDFFLQYPAVPLYVLIGTTFLLSLLYAVSLPRIPNLKAFSFFQVMVDVLYYTVVVYFTGGASSAFTLIYIFPIIASGILHYRRGALLTASAASVLFGLLINLEFYRLIPESPWPWLMPWAREAPGYILWLMVVYFTVFFLAALLSSSIAEQLQRTRMVLKLKETDFNKLSDLHSSIVRSIPSGIVTTDESDRITFVNAAGTRLLGGSLPTLLSIPIRQVFPIINDGLTKSGVRSETYGTVKEIEGKQLQLELTVSDLKSYNGTPRGRLVVFEDVTRLRRMEERVKISERQSALVRMAAGMAHEIRNPLAALRGAAELLSRVSSGVVDEKKLLGIVVRESDRLNKLLGDFFLTIDARSRQKVGVMLDDLVEETVRLFSKDPRVIGTISLETLITRGVEIEGDAARLKQALWHLLDNACDAITEDGTIRVTLEPDPTSDLATLRIEDSGPGIQPEIRHRIFEPFSTSKDGRTGLGLPIVLSIIEAHNGTIEVENTLTGGAAVTVRLPLSQGESSTKKGGHKNG
ncbi:MAG: ATP-binding protein [Deltaproteobacteria bacterium]